MSDSEEEQLDQVASGEQQASGSEAQSDSFRGFEGSTYLRYQVLGDLEGEIELNVEDHLEVSQDLLERAINESEETYYELEDISDQLRALSPILDRNSEFELAQPGRDESSNSQIRATSSRRNSLVSQRISFFDNMATSTTANTTSSITTSSTSTTSAPTMYTQSGVGSVMSPMLQGSGVQQVIESERTMNWLELRVEFASEDLESRIEELLYSFEDEENDHVPADKAACLLDMKYLEIQLEEWDSTFQRDCITIEKERQRVLQKKILDYGRKIKLLKVAAGYEDKKDSVTPHIAPPQEYKLAKVKPLEFPRFDGSDYSVFHPWKLKITNMLKSTSIPQDMWGVIVSDHLEGSAKKYIGCRGGWQGKYQELWEKLDSRYANRWTMAAETIKCSIMSTPPEDDWQKMIEYIDDQLDCIRSISFLDLTPEQLAVNVLLMKLPEDFANAIRNGIRIKRKDQGLQDFKFSPTDFRDVLNDTVVTWKATSPNLVASTSVLQTTFNQNKVWDQDDYKTSDHKMSGNGSGSGGARGRGQGGPRGGSRGRSSYNRNYSKVKCQLCDGEHSTPGCPSYLTAVGRRKQLVLLNKCPDCARIKHDDACKLRFNCRICNKGMHMDYLCPGLST